MSAISATIIKAKEAKGMTWEAVADAIGMSPVWTCSACMGMNSMPQDKAWMPVLLPNW
jgi:cyanate lyase